MAKHVYDFVGIEEVEDDTIHPQIVVIIREKGNELNARPNRRLRREAERVFLTYLALKYGISDANILLYGSTSQIYLTGLNRFNIRTRIFYMIFERRRIR
jgi:hypothetical protein